MERLKKRSLSFVKNSQEKAATKIQAHWRGNKARDKVNKKKAEKQEQNHAARTIQAKWKHRQKRERIKTIKKDKEYAADKKRATMCIESNYKKHLKRKKKIEAKRKKKAEQ